MNIVGIRLVFVVLLKGIGFKDIKGVILFDVKQPSIFRSSHTYKKFINLSIHEMMGKNIRFPIIVAKTVLLVHIWNQYGL